MERFMPLLLTIWCDACRHMEIAESVARMAPILARRLPVDLVVVRRLDLQHSLVETVATGVCLSSVQARGSVRTDCKPEDIERILSWCREGNVIRSHARDISD